GWWWSAVTSKSLDKPDSPSPGRCGPTVVLPVGKLGRVVGAKDCGPMKLGSQAKNPREFCLSLFRQVGFAASDAGNVPLADAANGGHQAVNRGTRCGSGVDSARVEQVERHTKKQFAGSAQSLPQGLRLGLILQTKGVLGGHGQNPVGLEGGNNLMSS